MSSDAKLQLQEDFFRQSVEYAEMEREMDLDKEMELELNDPSLDQKCQEMREGVNRY